MTDRASVRIRRRNDQSRLQMAALRRNGDQVHRMSDNGRIANADRQKGRRKRMTNQPQRAQVVVAGARRPGDGDSIALDTAVFCGDHDCDRVVPLGQSHLMARDGAISIGRQNGN